MKWGKSSGEFRVQSEQETGEEGTFSGTKPEMIFRMEMDRQKRNCPVRKRKKRDPSGDGFDNDAQSETEPKDQVPEAPDGEENGEGTAPEEERTRKRSLEQSPDEETGRKLNTEPGTGERTRKYRKRKQQTLF